MFEFCLPTGVKVVPHGPKGKKSLSGMIRF
jgi:hypothetical protein